MKSRYLTLLLAGAVLVPGCTGSDGPSPRQITIPDLTGLSRDYAVSLIDQLDIEIRIEEVNPAEIGSNPSSLGSVQAGLFPGDAVLRQDPIPDTRVDPGATITLFVAVPRALRPGEERFRLITHCGLSYPLVYDHRRWLPVEPGLRRAHNPPEGFRSDGYADHGFIQRIDEDTLVYTSSTGIEVEYEPTQKRRGGCE